MIDKCSGCIRIDPDMQFQIKTCPKCNEKTYECYLDGRVYIMECKNCGESCLSFSYYGNCECQRELFEYILDFSNVNQKGLTKFGMRYNVKVITLKKIIRMNKNIRLRCEISDALEEEEFFKDIGVGYTMDSNFYSCKDAIRTKRLNRLIEVVIDE